MRYWFRLQEHGSVVAEEAYCIQNDHYLGGERLRFRLACLARDYISNCIFLVAKNPPEIFENAYPLMDGCSCPFPLGRQGAVYARQYSRSLILRDLADMLLVSGIEYRNDAGKSRGR